MSKVSSYLGLIYIFETIMEESFRNIEAKSTII